MPHQIGSQRTRMSDAKRQSQRAGPLPADAEALSARMQEGLDRLNLGVAIFDEMLRLVASNSKFRKFRNYPKKLVQPGTPLLDILKARLQHARSRRGCRLFHPSSIAPPNRRPRRLARGDRV